jgi:hypothetical protein
MSVGGFTMGTQEHESHARVTPLYRRELPGGGFVAIDVCGSSTLTGERAPERRELTKSDAEVPRTRIYVERRSDQTRRAGHEPPIVAEVMGEVSPSEAGELYRMAADNAALARALLAWQSRRLAESAAGSQ